MDLHTPEYAQEYDFRRYDRIWQRVAPGMEPYPPAENTQLSRAGQENELPGAVPENELPGAVPDPCCMGSAAQEMLEVLSAYIEEEFCDRRYYLALHRTAPTWARQTLRTLAEEEGGHAKRLMAVYYLITGQCYHPMVSCGQETAERWCPALRMRYHSEVCNGFNYARSSEETTDVCLRRIFHNLSEEEFRHAEKISALLERSLQT